MENSKRIEEIERLIGEIAETPDHKLAIVFIATEPGEDENQYLTAVMAGSSNGIAQAVGAACQESEEVASILRHGVTMATNPLAALMDMFKTQVAEARGGGITPGCDCPSCNAKREANKNVN